MKDINQINIQRLNKLRPRRGTYESFLSLSRKQDEEYILWRTLNPNDMSMNYKHFVPVEGEFFIITDRRELRVADGIHQYIDCPIFCSGEELDMLINYHEILSKQIEGLKNECDELKSLSLDLNLLQIKTRVIEVLLFIMIIVLGVALC